MAEITASHAAPEPAPVLFKKRANKPNLRKRQAAPPPASQSDSDSEYSSEDGVGRRIKRQKRGGIATSSSGAQWTKVDGLKVTEFTADKTSNIQKTNDATRQSNWYDETAQNASNDQKALDRSGLQPKSESDKPRDGIYKGSANYQSFIQKNPNAPDRKVGPIKAPTNIRTVTTTDFAPDVCKDYKQTGFCGFGDSCKFLHAREDYKQGWELDRDWEIGTKGKKTGGTTVASANRASKDGEEYDEEAENELLESIPFACIICQQPYKFPIVTICNHYFCEKCALSRYKKTPNCAACGSGTGGVFNSARQLKRLLEKKQQRAKNWKQNAREAGEEVSSDDEE